MRGMRGASQNEQAVASVEYAQFDASDEVVQAVESQ
jgi:hypothetical protein